MPKPKEGESRKDFVGRCVPIVMDEGTAKDNKQAVAVCNSMYEKKESKKEQSGHLSKVRGIEIKEVEGEFYASGFIATTHVDEVNDKIPKVTLEQWAKAINGGSPKSNKASYHHNREPKVVGKGEPTASVVQLPDGEWGLAVTTHLNATWEGIDDLVYEVENGFVDGFSVEYYTNDGSTTHTEYVEGEAVRVLGPETELEGWGFASRPVQPQAVITEFGFKEVMKTKNKEEPTMPKTTEIKEEEKAEAAPEEKAGEVASEEKTKPEEAAPAEEKTDEEKAEEKEFKEWKKSKSDAEFKERVAKIVDEKISVKEKVMKTEQKDTSDKPVEVKEFEEVMLNKKKIDIKEQFRRAGMLAEKYGLHDKKTSEAVRREYKQFQTNGRDLEYKGLGVTTNQNTDTDYLQSTAELQDVYDPVIYNAINQATVTWNVLQKDNFANKGNNLVQFVLKTAANATATFYTGNSVTTGNVTRLKYQTKFKKLQVGVSVDGDMIAAARGGPVGDVFAQEVLDSTMDMLAVLNAALYAEAGAETAAAVIGFEYITDSAGNTTLYNLTRSAANKLSPDSATDTYINQSSTMISMTNLRAAIRQAVVEGASKRNLVFFTNPTQGNMLRNKFDDSRRMLTSQDTDFGFATDLFVDGIPVFEDKDCNTDDWFLVDLETHRVAIWVPPTIERLGKVGDAEDAFVKMYLATYNRAPRRMVQIYGAATS